MGSSISLVVGRRGADWWRGVRDSPRGGCESDRSDEGVRFGGGVSPSVLLVEEAPVPEVRARCAMDHLRALVSEESRGRPRQPEVAGGEM